MFCFEMSWIYWSSTVLFQICEYRSNELIKKKKKKERKASKWRYISSLPQLPPFHSCLFIVRLARWQHLIESPYYSPSHSLLLLLLLWVLWWGGLWRGDPRRASFSQLRQIQSSRSAPVFMSVTLSPFDQFNFSPGKAPSSNRPTLVQTDSAAELGL